MLLLNIDRRACARAVAAQQPLFDYLTVSITYRLNSLALIDNPIVRRHSDETLRTRDTHLLPHARRSISFCVRSSQAQTAVVCDRSAATTRRCLENGVRFGPALRHEMPRTVNYSRDPVNPMMCQRAIQATA